MTNSTNWLIAFIVAAVIFGAIAQPRAITRPFDVYQSGGNCIYVLGSRMSVVPVGQGGC